MNILLDTHTLIWFLEGERKKLSEKSLSSIENEQNQIFVSIASVWEISIKINIGKLELKNDFNQLMELLDHNNFILLTIQFKHLQKIINLDLIHRDPFDRLLIAQAISQDLQVVTKDPNFSRYNIKTIW
jgi:PIN domain nuclease of toxin-antitoxin system